MTNFFNKFGMALVIMMTLTACGKKNAPARSDALQPSNPNAHLQIAVDSAKCKSQISVAQGPEGYSEVQPEALKASGVIYQLSIVYMQGVMIHADGHTGSAEAVTGVVLDEGNVMKESVQEVKCRDLRAGEKLRFNAQPHLAINAETGEFKQRLLSKMLINDKTEDKSVDAHLVKEGSNFFEDLAAIPEQQRKMQLQGDDATVRYYMNDKGEIEIRMAAVSSVRKDGSRYVLNSAIHYVARKPSVK